MTHSLQDPGKPIGIYPDFAHHKPCSLSVLSVSASLFSHLLLSHNTEYGGQRRITQTTINNNPQHLSVSPYLFILRVSPKAIAQAFKSFHSLLSLNTEAGENGDAERFKKILEKGATALCVLTV